MKIYKFSVDWQNNLTVQWLKTTDFDFGAVLSHPGQAAIYLRGRTLCMLFFSH